MKKYQPRVRALKLARQVRERLTEELKQPVKVIMFGSQARGDTKKDSEDSSMMYLASDVAWEVGLDASKVISVVPAEKNEWRRLSASPFYRAVKREGIVV